MTFTLGPALLFCPADRPDRYTKALDRADAVILDLEDAVAPAAKEAARTALLENRLDPSRTIVRVNASSTADFDADLVAVEKAGYRQIMVAKSDASLPRLSAFEVIALCETAAGVGDARELAARPEVVALMWGAEDLVASLGGTSSRTATGALPRCRPLLPLGRADRCGRRRDRRHRRRASRNRRPRRSA